MEHPQLLIKDYWPFELDGRQVLAQDEGQLLQQLHAHANLGLELPNCHPFRPSGIHTELVQQH
ncbi:hypothetical protein GGI01_000415 [Coemansia sp. RSA 376]|nr:hypothetical protein GGI01_000415 [Coemansia sp. RSA 376]